MSEKPTKADEVLNLLEDEILEAETFELPNDVESEDGDVVPAGTVVKVLKATEKDGKVEVSIESPDGVKAKVFYKTELAKKLKLI